MSGPFEDGRKVTGIKLPDELPIYADFEVVKVAGQGAYVPWLAVTCSDGSERLYNVALLEWKEVVG